MRLQIGILWRTTAGWDNNNKTLFRSGTDANKYKFTDSSKQVLLS
jgi:hypothetical protein